jgi:hypothetical protein
LQTQFTPHHIERFWSKVSVTEGCWRWLASRSPGGYGKFYINKLQFYAHRVSYELAFGPIPPRLLVCHRCDVPYCVNPEHLFLGTQSDNMQDAQRKGRNRGTFPKGSIPPNQKLTPEIVREIRLRHTLGERQVSLARRFRITQANVSLIVLGKTWQHVE